MKRKQNKTLYKKNTRVKKAFNKVLNTTKVLAEKIYLSLKEIWIKLNDFVKIIGKKYFNKDLKRRTTYLINAVTLVCFIAIIASGVNTFAKYYSQQRQKGVAMASNFYFSSDILAKGVKVDENGPVSGFAEYPMSGKWNKGGTSSSYTFNIRNFENNLLYNDDNLNVKYNVYFKLEKEEQDGIECTISDGQYTTTVSTTTGYMKNGDNIKEYSLDGGSAKNQTFTVSYKHNAGSEYPVGLYIWVVPTAPDYISRESYTLGAKVKLSESVSAFSLTGEFDLGLSSSDDFTEADKELITEQSGFVYKISTSGSHENDQVPLVITWNTKYLGLDKFSSIGEYQVGDDGIATAQVNINTFSSMDLIFYKTAEFEEKDEWTRSEFENLVTVKEKTN